MNIHRWKWYIATAMVLIVGIVLVANFRNRLSEATVVGHWQGYSLQPSGVKERVGMTFLPDGFVIRDGNLIKMNYMVCDSAIVLYNNPSRNARNPVLWNARLIGDTLTLSGSEPVAVLRRVQLSK